MRWILIFLIAFIGLILSGSAVLADGKTLKSQFLTYSGKTFKGAQDPEFIAYDLALREYLVKRINKRYGIALDPKTYSGFDLLEIEALFKCKRQNEPYDLFLKMFPKQR